MFRARATEPGRDSDMRRSVPTDPLLARQPKAREENLGPRKTACKSTHILRIHSYCAARSSRVGVDPRTLRGSRRRRSWEAITLWLIISIQYLRTYLPTHPSFFMFIQTPTTLPGMLNVAIKMKTTKKNASVTDANPTRVAITFFVIVCKTHRLSKFKIMNATVKLSRSGLGRPAIPLKMSR